MRYILHIVLHNDMLRVALVMETCVSSTSAVPVPVSVSRSLCLLYSSTVW